MKYYKKMIGERVYLSPINQDEVEPFIKWMNEDRELAVNFGEYSAVISTKSDLGWLFDPPKHMHRFAIVLLEGDLLIGSISIHNIDPINRSAY